jgi:hypothetical protein
MDIAGMSVTLPSLTLPDFSLPNTSTQGLGGIFSGLGEGIGSVLGSGASALNQLNPIRSIGEILTTIFKIVAVAVAVIVVIGLIGLFAWMTVKSWKHGDIQIRESGMTRRKGLGMMEKLGLTGIGASTSMANKQLELGEKLIGSPTAMAMLASL